MEKAESIEIFEVGLRDGLQNEPRPVSLETKIALAHGLIQAGISSLELGAFVRPDQVPQMAETDRLFSSIQSGRLRLKSSQVWCLIPNRKGLERALKVGATQIAVFSAATESFAESNIGMTINGSFSEFRKVIADARAHLGLQLKVRGYVSTAFGCPFEGRVSAKKALRVIEKMAELQVDQISVGDTIGVAHPKSVKELIQPALRQFGEKRIAVHFHDTRGTALANTLRAIDLGVRTVDSSVGGLGGCPFAPGASGNLATEDLVYMLNGMKFKTGVNLETLCKISLDLARKMKRPLTSRYLQVFASGVRDKGKY